MPKSAKPALQSLQETKQSESPHWTRSIGSRLLVAFVLIVLLPTIANSIVSTVLGLQNGRQQVINQLESVAILKEAEIEAWVNRLKTDLPTLLTGKDALQYTTALLAQEPIEEDYQNAYDELQGRFRQTIGQTDLFEQVFLMNLKGRVLLSTDAAQENKVFRNQTYFRQGLKETYVHPPLYSPTLDQMSVIAAHPVVDQEGNVVGVLAGQASMETLDEIMLERAGLGQTGETYLVGANHVLLSESRTAVQDAASVIYIRTEAVNAAIDAHINSSGLYNNYQDVPVIGVYRWLPEFHVALLAEQAQSEAFHPVYTTLRINAGVALVFVVIAVVASLFVTRSIATPLVRLAKTAGQIANGDLSARATVQGRDEVGILAATFNQMVESIQQAGETLRESEERYRGLFEGVPIGLYRSTPEGQLIDVNPALIHMLGYPDRETLLAADPASFYVNPRGRQQWQALMERDGVVRDFEIQIRRHDGTVIWVRDTARISRGSDGRVLYYEGSLEDTTEHNRLEEQLRQSQKMDAIGRLAGGIAHDFNNLLLAIMGYSDLVLGKLDYVDPLRRDIQEIKKAGERAALLTSQLLTFSRKQVLQPKVLDINAVVTDMGNMLRRLISEDVELVTILDPDLGRVKADPGQIDQVIMNLVVNACEAMPQGGRLVVETTNVDLDKSAVGQYTGMPPGPYVMLVVGDTGVGMDEETRSHIFEPFFTTKKKGTGLGLSTVYGIVKQSGGHISVRSKPGQGTTLKIYLPQVDEATKQSQH